MRTSIAVAVLCFSALAPAQEPGTIGAGFLQLYDEQQANKRGELVIIAAPDGFPAAKAGIRPGDIVLAMNGSPVGGRTVEDITRKDIKGAVGSTLKMTLLRPSDGKQMNVELTRAAFPVQENPPSDPFHYSFSSGWQAEQRWPFPLPWSPQISYRGFEDLIYAPDFDDPASPHYHTYLFFWWLEGAVSITPAELESDMDMYYRGLTKQRGENYKFTVDVSRVSVNYTADPKGAATFGGSPAKSFRGEVRFYDTHGKIISLHAEVVATFCPGSNHTAVFFGLSQEPRDAGIWSQIDRIRDTFQCGRR